MGHMLETDNEKYLHRTFLTSHSMPGIKIMIDGSTGETTGKHRELIKNLHGVAYRIFKKKKNKKKNGILFAQNMVVSSIPTV